MYIGYFISAESTAKNQLNFFPRAQFMNRPMYSLDVKGLAHSNLASLTQE